MLVIGFVVLLVLLCYLAISAKTGTRRVVAVMGMLLMQVSTFVWIQILARAASSRVDSGLESMSAAAFFYQIRPVLLLQILLCFVLVMACVSKRRA